MASLTGVNTACMYLHPVETPDAPTAANALTVSEVSACRLDLGRMCVCVRGCVCYSCFACFTASENDDQRIITTHVLAARHAHCAVPGICYWVYLSPIMPEPCCFPYHLLDTIHLVVAIVYSSLSGRPL